MLAVQGVSYALITSVLLVYCYAGTIPMIIPSAYFLSGIGLVSVFVVLSEAHFNDRFEDHYLTIFQVAGHVALQLCFLLAAPRNRICLPQRRIPHLRIRRAANDLAAGNHLLDAHHDRPGADLPL